METVENSTENIVYIKDNSFLPEILSISAGTSVSFINNDYHPHKIHWKGHSTMPTWSIRSQMTIKHHFGKPGRYLMSSVDYVDMKCTIEIVEMQPLVSDTPKLPLYFPTAKDKLRLQSDSKAGNMTNHSGSSSDLGDEMSSQGRKKAVGSSAATVIELVGSVMASLQQHEGLDSELMNSDIVFGDIQTAAKEKLKHHTEVWHNSVLPRDRLTPSDPAAVDTDDEDFDFRSQRRMTKARNITPSKAIKRKQSSHSKASRDLWNENAVV